MKHGHLVIVDGIRTPFCRLGTDLRDADAVELGRVAVSALLTRTGVDPASIDEVLFGCVGQPAEAANLARVIALRAGIPDSVPAITVQRNCASGLEALTLAADKLAAGQGEAFIVGGVESMSRLPLQFRPAAADKFARLHRAKSLLQKLRAALSFRPADFRPLPALQLGLRDPVSGLNMGQTAELLAREFHISRAEQDDWALQSHQRAVAAQARLQEEIAPVYLRNGKITVIERDNGPRAAQSAKALAALPTVFDTQHGSVTAGNSSQLTDGAVALLVMSERRAEALGRPPLGRLLGYAHVGCDPKRMGLGPVHAMLRAAEITGLTAARADIIEINEAFAAQVLAVLRRSAQSDCARVLGALRSDNINVSGGAIALGHPLGATGARLVLTALRELHHRNGRRALVSLCVGGGQGSAAWLEILP